MWCSSGKLSLNFFVPGTLWGDIVWAKTIFIYFLAELDHYYSAYIVPVQEQLRFGVEREETNGILVRF